MNRRSARRRLVVWSAIGMGVLGSAALGYLFASQDRAADCGHLLKNGSLQRVLGNEYVSDMSCAELGSVLRAATTGATPGRHTLGEARNMQAVVLALSEETQRRRNPAVAVELREPLADALVDYAADIHANLTGSDGDPQPQRHRRPWKDGETVRMPVEEDDLIRALRAVSQDPQAYARLRTAQTEKCADGLASVPTARSLSVEDGGPALDCAVVLGHFDGIADDIPEGERATWQAAVFQHIADTAPESAPSYGRDPAGHIAGAWQRDFVGVEPPSSGFLGEDALAVIDIWAEGREEDSTDSGVKALKRESLTVEADGAEAAARLLACTREPDAAECG
ncbi:hypothetical protein [Streptomyces cavernicola]|uniref:Secreted protein n=1 Tax=Streptomyces cavernicola TaxID=3043613 RepID=A0ABT6SJL5_9ACTN|nr:hypothetical protein [Streptomyces sp. B-S-A6]MDI3408393.1 hypothetical protein [Streptomyces sp. B-S-A6]